MKATQERLLEMTFNDFMYKSHKTIDSYYHGKANYLNVYDLLRFLCEPYCNTDLCIKIDYPNYVNCKLQAGEDPHDLKKFKTNARDRLVKPVERAVSTLTEHYSGVKKHSQKTLKTAQSDLGIHTCFAQDKNGSVALVVPFNKKSLTGFLKVVNNKKEEKIAATAKSLQKLTKQKDILSAEVTKHVLANCLLENTVLGATPNERIKVIVEWLLYNFSQKISQIYAPLNNGYKEATAIYRGAKGLEKRADEDKKLIANGQTRRQRNNHKARN